MNVAAVLTIVLSDDASAHVGDLIDTLDAARTDEGFAVLGTFGLMLPAADGEYEWVCHEVVTAPGALTSPDYVLRDGRILAWMSDLAQARDGVGVWTSTDGCGWAPATGVDGRIVAEVSLAADGSAWLATADPTGNGLYRAANGVDFTPAFGADGRFLSVRADGPAVWALSVVGDADLTLWHSPDGQTFTGHPIPAPAGISGALRGRIGAIHPSDPTQAWLILDPVGTDRVVQVTASGASLTEVWDAPDRVTDFGRAEDGALYAILNDRRPWRATDGAFVELVDLPDASGLDATGQPVAFANRTFVNHLLLTESDDGATADRSVGPGAIRGPLQCPSGSEAAQVCDPLWPLLEPRLAVARDTGDTGGPPVPPPPEDTDPPDTTGRTCGCVSAAGGGAAGPAALWAVAALLRRRNRTSAR